MPDEEGDMPDEEGRLPDEVGDMPDQVGGAGLAELARIARDLSLAGLASWGLYDVARARWLYVVGTPPPQPDWGNHTVVLVISGDGGLSVQDVTGTGDLALRVLDELRTWAMDSLRRPFPELVVGEVLEPSRLDGRLTWAYRGRPVAVVGELARPGLQPRPAVPPPRD